MMWGKTKQNISTKSTERGKGTTLMEQVTQKQQRLWIPTNQSTSAACEQQSRPPTDGKQRLHRHGQEFHVC